MRSSTIYAAALPLLSLITPVWGEGCYSGGQSFDQVASVEDLASTFDSVCADVSGVYYNGERSEQTPNYRCIDIGENRIEFSLVYWYGDPDSEYDTYELFPDICSSDMYSIMNACIYGGSVTVGLGMVYNIDPQAGNCA